MGQRPPPYELFFAPLLVMHDPNTIERIEFAYFASKYGHHKQVRDDGARFFDHPKGAAWIYIDELGGRDADAIIVMLLHDLSEDTYLLSPYRLRLNFGAECALDVRAVTKLPKGKETTSEYLGRVIERGWKTILAKLCDRLHNVRTLVGCEPEKRRRYIDETRQYYIPFLIPELTKFGGVYAEYAEKLLAMIEEDLIDAERSLDSPQ